MNAIATLSAVTRRYGKQLAVDQLDLSIPAGGVFALLGPNGAGKTTTIGMLLGLQRPDAGTVRVLGRRPGNIASRREIGVMLQVSGVPTTLTVREHIALFSGYYPAPLPFDRVVSMAGLEGIVDRRFGKLSGGQQQRVLFALAICGDPALLFLDEPTVGLDVEARRGMWRVIRDQADAGRTVVLTTHYLEEADALADRIGVLHRGRLVAEDTPAKIKGRIGGKVVRCTTAVSDAELRAMPGVRSVTRVGARVELTTTTAETLLRALLAADPHLAGIEVSGIGLDDAFLALTGAEAEAA